MNAIKFAIIGCAMITGIMRADGPPNEAFNDNELSRETQIRTAFIGLTPNQPKETIDKNLKVVVSGGVITLQVLVLKSGELFLRMLGENLRPCQYQGFPK